MRSTKGITLVSLVITIIVMLILAAVSLSMVVGEGSVIEKATEAQTQQAHANVKDRISLEYTDWKVLTTTKKTTATFKEYLQAKNYVDENGVVKIEELVPGNNYLGKGTGTNDTYKVEETEGNFEIKYFDVESNENNLMNIPMPVIAKRKIKFYIKIGYGSMNYSFSDPIELEANEDDTWAVLSTIPPWGDDGKAYYGNTLPPRLVYLNYSEEEEFTDRVLKNDKIIEGHCYYGEWVGAECVHPESEILVSLDGDTVLAKDIEENEDIAYYDFDSNEVKVGKISKKYVHEKATNLVKYVFEDGSYVEVTDYHPIYTKEGWKSLTNRNGYEKPEVGDLVKSNDGWKKLSEINEYTTEIDCYDFEVMTQDGKVIDNYFANDVLVQGSY